jgi:flagellar basal body-associated protein FliL
MEKSKGSPLMFVIIVLLVLILGTVVAAVIYIISAFGGDDNDIENPRITPTPIILPEDLEWWELDEIRTNLLDPPPGRHSVFIVTPVLVGINTSAPRRELDALRQNFNFQRARTIANEVFYSATYTEARTPEGRAAIEERILARLQVEYGPLVVQISTPGWAIS